MNLFLEAFVDTNFGDNVFVHTIASRYPQHTFYMLVKEGFEASYQILTEQEKNVRLIQKEEENTFISKMDGMLIVGGDLFWNGNYRTWLDYIEAIKKKGGCVIFLGMSLFEEYTARTRFSLRVLFSQADVMVVRESQSGDQAKQIAPRANIKAVTDMAFTTVVSEILKEPPEQGLLGVSIRKKIPRNAPDAYAQYCQGMAATVVKYLEQSEVHRVNFLALSKGVYDDEAVAEDIMSLCPAEYQSRMQCVSFMGDVEQYICKMQKCEKMLCTRFHALVFAILLQKPFVPIAYEDKVKRLLKEIGYEGIQPKYEERLNPEAILEGLNNKKYSQEALSLYLDKSRQFFVEVDPYLVGTSHNKNKHWGFYEKLLMKIHKNIYKIWKMIKK